MKKGEGRRANQDGRRASKEMKSRGGANEVERLERGGRDGAKGESGWDEGRLGRGRKRRDEGTVEKEKDEGRMVIGPREKGGKGRSQTKK